MEQSEEERKKVEAHVSELRASKFKQMELPAWRPKQSFMSTAVIFLVFGSVFLGLGIFMLL